MAGGELIIDNKLLKILGDVDKKLEKIAKTSGSAQANIFKMFDKAGSQGVDGLIRKLQQLEKYYSTIGQNDSRGMKRIANDARKTADEINKLIAAVQQRWTPNFKGAMNYSQNAKTLSQDREAINRLRQARETLSRADSDYFKKLSQINGAIAVHSSRIRTATKDSHEMNKAHRGLMDTSGQLTRKLALIFSVSQVQGYISKVVQVRKEFELQQKALTAIIRDQDKANQLWNQTVALAVKSPFRVKELVTYTKQLTAYRIETEKLHDTTSMLADVSAGLGVDMNRLILAFGQVRAAEFLRGTELRQFTEAGIPMLEELANHFSALEGRAVSTADVFERISKRMVVFADVEAVFRKITSEGGTFYKMQEKQSETLYGTIANLHDSIDLMLNDIGKSNEGVLKAGLSQVKWLVEHWELLAEAIKGVAAALVIYKVRALAAKASVIDFAITQGIASGTQALKFTELLSVGWRKVAMAISAAKTALLSNPLAAIILAAAYAVSKLYSAWDDHNEQLADINKEYDELIRKVSNIRINFIFSDDLSKKKKELQSLIDTAEQLNISPNIKMDDVTNDNIDEIFNNLRQLVVERQGLITALSTDFEKATHWTFTDDLNEDLKEVGGNITKLTPIIDKYKSSVVDYIDKLGRLTDERKKMFEPIRKDENDLQYYDRLVRAFGEVRKAQKEASTSTEHWVQIMNEAPSVIKYTFDEITKWRANTNHYFDKEEAKKEFDAFIEEVLPMLKNIPEKDRSIAIKTWIDKEATKREWNTFTTQYLYKWFEEIPDLNIKFKAELPSEKSIPDWKMRVTDAVKKLNEKIKASLPEGSKIRLFTLPSDTDTKESWLNKFKGDIEEAKRVYQDNQAIFDEQEVARTNALSPYSREAEEIANIADKTTKEERDALKLMKERIALIKEMHSEYNKLRKHYSDEEAQLKVINAYSKSFKDAFGEWNIDMFRNVIDAQTLDQFHQLGTISDEVVGKIKQLADSGTYIRSFSDDFVDSIKKAEGFHDKAYKGDDNVWTIGYGETKGVKQGQTITQEAADLQLRTRLANDFKVQLNEILDKNKDLILTQEQYNALLDLSYQGGAGMVRRLIYLARNMDKSIEHVSNIQQKIGGVFGEEAAARFGDSFVQQLKDSENIYQRIALLLQTMNLTVRQGQISEKYYKGMQARSDKRSEWFATGKDISSVIASVTKQFKNVDISTKKGIVTFLESLAPIAAKEGEKVTEELNKAIDGFKAEIGIEVKIPKEKELIRRVENMFGTYELSLELKDMNIPSDLAEKLFGIESLDLEGLKAKLEELEPEFVGTDLEEKYRDYLQKVAKMEKEAQQKRLKEYVAFARGAIGERAKVKMEEMQKLEDIEKTFAVKDSDNEETKETKNKWRNEAIKKAQEEATDALKKLDWEALKSSDTFNMVFDDLDRASDASLKNMIDKLKEFRDQWKDMPFDQMRQVVDLLQKAEEAYNSSSSPFAEGRRLKKAIKKDGRTEKQALLDLSSAESELVTLDNIIAKIQLFQQVRDGLTSKEMLPIEDMELYEQFLSNSVGFYNQIVDGLSNESMLRTIINNLAFQNQLTEKGVLDLLVKQGKITQDEADKAKKRLTDGQKQAKVYEEQANAIKKMQQMANDLYDSFYDLANTVAEAFGGEISETGKIFAESGQEMMNTVLNTISLQKELQKASATASAFGKALNSAMGIVGWIVMGVQLISKVFSIVTQLHDNKIEKKIQSQIDAVEELEKQYKSLEKTLEHVYSIDTITKFSDDAVNNIDQQIAALDEMIALETEKKNQDEERIKEWYEQREESLEERERLLVEKEKALGGIGGEADYKDASERFVEAWIDAYQETGDGLKGLEEAFDEFFMNMVKKQLVSRGVEKIMEPFYKEFDKMFDKDSDGNEEVTSAELADVQKKFEELAPRMNATLKSVLEQMGATDEILKGGELGTLQKGIQGITEDQADVLASYLNSIRFIIGEHTGYLKTIASNYGDTEVPNPMLGQLQVIANQTSAIHTLLESVTKTGHPQGGYGIKVIM